MNKAATDSDYAFKQIFALTLSSDEEVTPTCCQCRSYSIKEPAYGYCQDCVAHLCRSCYQHHSLPLPTQDHVLLNYNRMPKSQTTKVRNAAVCEKHENKFIEYHCKTCDELCCIACTLQHRECNVCYIMEEVSKPEMDDNISALLQRMESLIAECHKVKKDASANQSGAQRSGQDLEAQLKAFREKINVQLDKWELELRLKNIELHEEERATAKSVVHSSAKIAMRTVNLKDNLTKMTEMAENSSMRYIQLQKDEHLMQTLEAELEDLQKHFDITEYEFIPNSKTLQILAAENSIGKIIPKSKAKQCCVKEWIQGLCKPKGTVPSEASGLRLLLKPRSKTPSPNLSPRSASPKDHTDHQKQN